MRKILLVDNDKMCIRDRFCPAKAQAGTACPQACRPEKAGAGAITMAKRKRDVPVLFWVSAEELN